MGLEKTFVRAEINADELCIAGASMGYGFASGLDAEILHCDPEKATVSVLGTLLRMKKKGVVAYLVGQRPKVVKEFSSLVDTVFAPTEIVQLFIQKSKRRSKITIYFSDASCVIVDGDGSIYLPDSRQGVTDWLNNATNPDLQIVLDRTICVPLDNLKRAKSLCDGFRTSDAVNCMSRCVSSQDLELMTSLISDQPDSLCICLWEKRPEGYLQTMTDIIIGNHNGYIHVASTPEGTVSFKSVDSGFIKTRIAQYCGTEV